MRQSLAVHITLSDADMKKLAKGAGISVTLPDGNGLVVSAERSSNGRAYRCKCGETYTSAQALNGHVNSARKRDGRMKHAFTTV